MNLIERLMNVRKRLDAAYEMKTLRAEDWQAILVSIIRDCQMDGAEAERAACAAIARDLEYKESFMYWQAVADEIERQIEARGEKPE